MRVKTRAKVLWVVIVVAMLLTILISCTTTQYLLKFEVDGEVIHSINTAGN